MQETWYISLRMFSPQRPDRFWATPISDPVSIADFCPMLNEPEREAGHSQQSTAEIKNNRAKPQLPHIRVHSVMIN
jgi:hypothetical protein